MEGSLIGGFTCCIVEASLPDTGCLILEKDISSGDIQS